MPLPGNLTAVTLTGTYVTAVGTPCSGSVTFYLDAVIADATGSVILYPSATVATLDINGHFSIELPATNDTHLYPEPFTYRVLEKLTGAQSRVYSISLPSDLAPTVDLSALTPSQSISPVGVTITGTPTAGQVPTATGPSNADWQTPTGGAGDLVAANNLSDVESAPTARTNLGLGTAATQASSAFDAAGSASTAQSNAETYTTAQIAAEVTRANAAYDASGAAAAAQTASETYTAAQISAEVERANAAYDAVGAASTAQSAAESYTAAFFQPLRPWIFDVTASPYNAKGNGQIVTDGAMSLASTTLTSTSGLFAVGDIGKAIQVKGAGSTGVTTLVTTISAYNSPTSVTLAAANASGSAQTGLTVLWASDDTAAIQSAINAAVGYAQGHGGAATVLFPAAAKEFYGIAGALNTSASGNAQLTIPVVATIGNKLVITFQGAGDGAAQQHWQQVPPQMSGSTLVSFGVFASTSAQTASINAHGNPSLLGGPSEPGGYGVSPGVFTNVHVVLQGLSLRTVHTAWGLGYTAADLDGCANAALRDFGYGTLGTVGNGDFGNPSLFGTGLDIGLLLPISGNNDLVVLDNVTCFGGYTYGLFATEHTDMLGVRILYCWAGLCPVGLYDGSVGSTHAIRGFVSVEACHYQLYLIGAGSGGVGPYLHLLLDSEGSVLFGDNGSGTPSISARGQVVLTGEVTLPISLDWPVGYEIVNDQISFPATVVTSAYTVTALDEVIEADATSGAYAVTLPTAVGRSRRVTIVKVDSTTNAITITPQSGQTIDGASSIIIAAEWGSVTLSPSPTGSWRLGCSTVDTTDLPKRPASPGTPGSSPLASPCDHAHPWVEFTAQDHGYLTWSDKPTACNSTGTAPSAQQLQLVRLHLPVAATVTNLVLFVQSVTGVSLTSGENFAGLYTSSGTLLSATADQSTDWTTTGTKPMALVTPQACAAGDYYLGFFVNGSTLPTFAKSVSGFSIVNTGLMASNSRYATGTGSLTTAMPGTYGTLSGSSNAFWAALS